jgi:hypothetical protein
MTAVLRGIAIAIALAGALDPSFAVKRAAPVAIDVYADRVGDAGDVRARLADALGSDARISTGEPPQAVVFVGQPVDPELVPDDVPVSTIAVADRPNVRIVSGGDPVAILPGQSALIAAEVEGIGVGGQTSVFVLEQQGLELGRAEHRWATDGRALIEIPFAAGGPGAQSVRLAARPVDGERRLDDNAVDVQVVVHAQRPRVFVYEPRPSWAAGFVRAQLEADPRFDVSSLLHPSRSIDVRSGQPPRAPDADAFSRFDVIVVGAPEDLRARDVQALDEFAVRRGGAVVLVPDRRPSGAYTSILPVPAFDEVLLEKPAVLEPARSSPLTASELAIPRDRVIGASALAELSTGAGRRPVVFSWPRGDGRVIFSGALDAWRYRGYDGNGFRNFWRELIAHAAMTAPPRVAVSLDRGVVRPGARVRMRARLRRSEFEGMAAASSFPEVRAEWVGANAPGEQIRMWPGVEIGVYEGAFDAPGEGSYAVRVSTSGGASTDAPFIVRAEAAAPRRGDDDATTRALVAQVTGGVAAAAADLSPIVQHVRTRATSDVGTTVHPMRSPWWILPFAAVLCAEWGIRRKRGLP